MAASRIAFTSHEGSIIAEKVKEMKQDKGFNALTEKLDDRIKLFLVQLRGVDGHTLKVD